MKYETVREVIKYGICLLLFSNNYNILDSFKSVIKSLYLFIFTRKYFNLPLRQS